MNLVDVFPATSTRVQQHTLPTLNAAIRARTDAAVSRMESAGSGEIEARLRVLEHEWDIERVLQTNAAIISALGIALGAGADRRFLLLPAAVFSFFAQHALQGWCPPIPVFRRIGVRTTVEIERERYALKALRGDFDGINATSPADPPERIQAVLRAIDR